MPAAAAVAVVGSVAAGKIAADAQSRAARRASDAQVQASREANDTQREIFERQVQLLTPSARAGAQARARQMLMQGIPPDQVRAFLAETNASLGAAGPTQPQGVNPAAIGDFRDTGLPPFWGGGAQGSHIDDLIGRHRVPLNPGGGIGGGVGAPAPGQPDPYDWVDTWSYQATSPSYDLRFDEGQRALERSAAARGRLFSGGTGRALTEFGQNLASTEFENDFRRLGTLAGDGTQATGDIVVNAGNYGDAVSRNQLAAGNARASGYRASGDAQADFWGNTVPGAIGWGFGYGSKQNWWT